MYRLALAVFLALVALIIFRYEAKQKNEQAKVYYLLERSSSATQTDEWNAIVQKTNSLIQKLQDNPGDNASLISLASIYIQEGRVTGNHVYYDKAALKCVNDVLQKDENNFEALSLKSVIFLSEHHFAEALATAQRAVSINPYNAFVYGSLVDAYVELGNYEAAIESLDKMISIRPDLRSYARVSYLREIYGDYPGAIEAMKLAVEAGAPGDETTAWTRVQLGQLYEKTFDLTNAEMQYRIALEERPSYAYALAGLGRIALSDKRHAQAINLFLKADSLIVDYSIREELADAYMQNGELDKAEKLTRKIFDDMRAMNNSQSIDDSAAHYSDREIAYASLKINDYGNALRHALAEYNRRPENIDVNEMLAWTYYSQGKYSLALPYIKKALRTNSRNPTLLCRAGLIFSKAGEQGRGNALLRQVISTNPNLAFDLRSEAVKTLEM